MQHVVSQLIEKKSEIEGEINYYQGKINTLKKIVESMEVSLKVFEPDFDPKTVNAKKFNPDKRYFKHGEVHIKVLDLLRERNTQVSTHDVTVELMKMKKYDHTDKDLKVRLQKTILYTLKRQYKDGLIDRFESGERLLFWKIAD